MSEQREMDFATQHSRLHGEPTSYAAAVSMVNQAVIQCAVLEAALVMRGPMTCDEADAWLERLPDVGWKRTTSGRRMADLVRDGRAEWTGETRKTRSGRRANVYRVKVNAKEEAA